MLHRSGSNVPPVKAKDMNKISVVIPVLNEKETVNPLYGGLTASLRSLTGDYEMIFVDDGSSDGSYERLENIAREDSKVTVVKFYRRFGQTAAIMAGVELARGGIIVTIDGDMQNDPADLPKLVKKLGEGYDLVCGWRKERAGSYLMRFVPAYLAARLISRLFKVRLHDYGCTFKAFRAESIKNCLLLGEMHRFIPVIVANSGKKVTELVIADHPRRYGKSKYGIKRTIKVLCDLVVLKFMLSYSDRPMHFFGKFGIAGVICGFAAGFAAIYRMFQVNPDDIYVPALGLLSVFLFVTGVLILLIGILAEIGARIYYTQGDRRSYLIEKIINENS